MKKDKHQLGRIVSLLIVGIVLLLGVASAQAEKVTLTWSVWVDYPQDPAYFYLIDEWEQLHPETEIKLEIIPWASYWTKLSAMIAAGDIPDIIKSHSGHLPSLVGMDAIIPADDLIVGSRAEKQIVEAGWNASRYKGHYWGIPFEMIVNYLQYRVDWFEEAGIQPPTNRPEFLDTAKKMTKDTDGDGITDQWGFGMAVYNWYNQHHAVFLFDKKGGEISFYDAQGNLRKDYWDILRKPEAIRRTQWYVDLFREWKVVPPTAPMDQWSDLTGNFKSGRTAMQLAHIMTAKMVVEDLGDRVSASKAPGDFTVGDANTLCISSASKYKEAAFKFLDWFMAPGQYHRFTMYYGMPRYVPFHKSLQNYGTYAQNRFIKASTDSFDITGVFPRTAEMTPWQLDVWPTNMQRALLGEITVEKVMNNLADALVPE